MLNAQVHESGASREVSYVPVKGSKNLYFASVFSSLKEEGAVDLVSKFATLDAFISLTNRQCGEGERLNFPQAFNHAMKSAQDACVELERMAASNLEMLSHLLYPEECEGLTEEYIQNLLNGVKGDTSECLSSVKTVLRKFRDVRAELHIFIDALRSESVTDTSIPSALVEKFVDIIPWSYIPQFITALLHTTRPEERTPPERTPLSQRITPRSLTECLHFAEQLVERVDGLTEVWGALFRQVTLVSQLLAESKDFFNVNTKLEEVDELCDFFACLKAAARNFVDYVPRRQLITFEEQNALRKVLKHDQNLQKAIAEQL